MVNQRARSIVGDSPGRPALDYYPTPPEATRALLNVEAFPTQVLEPACGSGHIVEVLKERGHEVYALDIHDYGVGFPKADFLKAERPPFQGPWGLVTNPPFKLMQRFAENALRLGPRKIALFGKLAFLEGRTRGKTLFKYFPPSRVWVFSDRVSLYREGKKMKNSGMIAFAWYIWEQEEDAWPTSPPKIGWLMSAEA